MGAQTFDKHSPNQYCEKYEETIYNATIVPSIGTHFNLARDWTKLQCLRTSMWGRQMLSPHPCWVSKCEFPQEKASMDADQELSW